LTASRRSKTPRHDGASLRGLCLEKARCWEGEHLRRDEATQHSDAWMDPRPSLPSAQPHRGWDQQPNAGKTPPSRPNPLLILQSKRAAEETRLPPIAYRDRAPRFSSLLVTREQQKPLARAGLAGAHFFAPHLPHSPAETPAWQTDRRHPPSPAASPTLRPSSSRSGDPVFQGGIGHGTRRVQAQPRARAHGGKLGLAHTCPPSQLRASIASGEREAESRSRLWSRLSSPQTAARAMGAQAQGEALLVALRWGPPRRTHRTPAALPLPPPPLLPPPRPGTPTVVEEEQHGESQSGGGQEDEADVARDHEIPHHQGDFVLVRPIPLQGPRRHGVLASRHARPSRRGPKLNPPLTHPRHSSRQAHMDPSSLLLCRLR